MRVDIEDILDKHIRPTLIRDGGNIEVLEFDGNTLIMRLMGQCATCPISSQTIETFIEVKIQEQLPDLKEIIVEAGLSKELLDIAKLYLRRDE